jgi:hypothetical protein
MPEGFDDAAATADCAQCSANDPCDYCRLLRVAARLGWRIVPGTYVALRGQRRVEKLYASSADELIAMMKAKPKPIAKTPAKPRPRVKSKRRAAA